MTIHSETEINLTRMLSEYFTNRIDDGVCIQFEVEFDLFFGDDGPADYSFLIEKIKSIDILKFFPCFEFEKIQIGGVRIDQISFIPILKLNVYLKFNKIEATLIKLTR